MRPAHKALTCLLAGAIGYNILAEPGETISEGIDELLAKHPCLTRAVITAVARHLSNELVPWADPVGLVFVAIKHLRHALLP